MPQDTVHPDYQAHAYIWRRIQDAYAGRDAVIAGCSIGQWSQINAASSGSTQLGYDGNYLPRPSGMDPADYRNYVYRAEWFGGVKRTVAGLSGLIFRRPPQWEGVKDRTLAQVSNALPAVLALTMERLLTGQCGVLLDLTGTGRLINDLAASWTPYPALAIRNWQHAPDGTLLRVVLEEYAEVIDSDDDYVVTYEKRYRELVLIDGAYTSLLWAYREGRFVLLDEQTPLHVGRPLPFIPFAFLRKGAMPPLLDVVDLAYSYYRTSADYEHDLHFTSMQTPIFTGWQNTPQDIALGPVALITSNPDAKAFMLSPSPAGIEVKRQKLDDTISKMAMLGSRILEPQRRTVEATDTVQIRHAGEQTALGVLVTDLDALCTQAARWHSWLVGDTSIPDDQAIHVTLNKDYLPGDVSPQALTALVASWQAGALTEEGLHYNLAQGEMLPAAEHDFDVWQDRRSLQTPAI